KTAGDPFGGEGAAGEDPMPFEERLGPGVCSARGIGLTGGREGPPSTDRWRSAPAGHRRPARAEPRVAAARSGASAAVRRTAAGARAAEARPQRGEGVAREEPGP